MKLFSKSKDGGPESPVIGYWLIEAKNLFSIVLLKFTENSREAYHTHAFNAKVGFYGVVLGNICGKVKQKISYLH